MKINRSPKAIIAISLLCICRTGFSQESKAPQVEFTPWALEQQLADSSVVFATLKNSSEKNVQTDWPFNASAHVIQPDGTEFHEGLMFSGSGVPTPTSVNPGEVLNAWIFLCPMVFLKPGEYRLETYAFGVKSPAPIIIRIKPEPELQAKIGQYLLQDPVRELIFDPRAVLGGVNVKWKLDDKIIGSIKDSFVRQFAGTRLSGREIVLESFYSAANIEDKADVEVKEIYVQINKQARVLNGRMSTELACYLALLQRRVTADVEIHDMIKALNKYGGDSAPGKFIALQLQKAAAIRNQRESSPSKNAAPSPVDLLYEELDRLRYDIFDLYENDELSDRYMDINQALMPKVNESDEERFVKEKALAEQIRQLVIKNLKPLPEEEFAKRQEERKHRLRQPIVLTPVQEQALKRAKQQNEKANN